MTLSPSSSPDYFKRGDGGVPFDELRQTNQMLQKDADCDVRYFAGNIDPVGRKIEEDRVGGDVTSQGDVTSRGSEEFFDVEAAKC